MSIVVILLLLWVLSTEVIAFLTQRAACISRSAKENRQAMPGHLVRLLIFLVFGAFNMVSAFLPVFILDRSRQEIPLAWRGLAASLPVTINIFVMGIMALFCANLVRKLGVRKIFVISMGFSMCGNLILFLVPGYAPVIAGLVLDGIGVGLISNAMYVALTYLPNEEERQSGFNSYNAASLAGINFGMLSGGALAVNVGQRNVFLVVALMWAVLIVFGSWLAQRLEKNLQIRTDDAAEVSRISAVDFVRAKPIWTFIAFVQNPCIVFNSFVFFFVPIYCSRAGYNETIISLFLMLYSQLAVMLGESLPGYVDRTLGDRAVYLAMGLNVIAVAAFVLTGNTPAWSWP
jgi:MFS family permease